jgi:hypothetical protein
MVLRSTEPITREPKSLRGWMPESTMAIVGWPAANDALLSCDQFSALWDANGQFWLDEKAVEAVTGSDGSGVAAGVLEDVGLTTCTVPFGVIEVKPAGACVTRFVIWSPVSVALTPEIDEN